MTSTFTDPAARTPEEWTAMADECAARSGESWERSDTDGHLSQWANDGARRLYRAAAAIARCGNKHRIPWLFNAVTNEPLGDGQWRWVEGRYGPTVAIGQSPETVWFRPSKARDAARREAGDRSKGYVWGVIECEVLLYQYGTALQLGYRRKSGAEATVVSVGNYQG